MSTRGKQADWSTMFNLETVQPEEDKVEDKQIVDHNTDITTVDEVEETETTIEEEETEVEEKTEKVESKTTTEERKEESTEDNGVFTPFIPLIKEGVLSYNDEKEYDNSIDGIKDLIQDNINVGIESFKNQYPKEVWDVVEHLKNGGSLGELIQIEQEGPDYENDVDLTDENHQKYILEDWLAEQGFSEEKIKAKLSKYEEAGLIEEEAKSAHEKLVELQKKKKENLIKKQAEVAEQRKTEIKTKAENLKKKITESKDIAGFSLKQGEHQKLLDYMTKPVKDGKSQMQLEYDEDTQLKMAYFMMKKFDFSKVESSAATKATIKLKQAVSKATDPNLKTKGAVVPKEKKDDEFTDEIHGLGWITGPKKK